MSDLERQRDDLFRETQRAQQCIDDAKRRIGALETENARLREELTAIALTGTDVPAALGGGYPEGFGFYRQQLMDVIARAAWALRVKP